jgi:protein-S-isoprenylcysteine O-methyltransferase Ste14
VVKAIAVAARRDQRRSTLKTSNEIVEPKRHVKAGEHPFGDKGQLIGLAVFLAVWGLDSFVFRLTTFPARYVPFWARLAAAALAFIPAVLLALSGHRAVPHETEGEPRVITDGAFARVRHPLYLGSLLAFLSLVLATLSLAALAVLLGLFAFYNIIAAYEERWMTGRFGQAYEEYKREVPRWVPRLRG